MWSDRSGSYTRFTGSLHDIRGSGIRALFLNLTYLQHNQIEYCQFSAQSRSTKAH